MSNAVPVDIEFVLKNFDFKGHFDQMKNQIRGVSTTAQTEADKTSRMMKQLASGIGVYFSASFLRQFITEIANVRGEFQQLEVALQTILKSKSKADALMNQVVDFAAKTPFELKDVAKGTKQLLAYQFAAEDIIGTMRMLGDISAGVSVPIGDLVYLYGTLRTQGRAYARDIMQFTSRGIPVVAELAKQFDIGADKVMEMVTAGKVGFKEIETAFKSMTEQGGMFEGLMEKQSKTITGLASNLSDAWARMMNDIGKSNEGIIADAITGATNLVDNYEDVLDVLKVLVATYGAYKAAVIASAVANNYAVAAGGVKAWFELARGIKTAKDAQIAFNLATKANPYGLALAGITALVSVLTIYNRKQKESREEIEKQLQPLRDQYRQTNELIGKLNDSNIKEEERHEILEKLKQINPDIVEGIKDESKAFEILSDRLQQYNKEQLAAMNVKEYSITGGFQESAQELTEVNEKLNQQKTVIIGTYTELFNRFHDLVRNNKDIPEDVKSLFESIFQSNADVPEKVESLFAAYYDVQSRIRARAGKMGNNGAQERVTMSLFQGLDITKYEKDLKKFNAASLEYTQESEELKQKILDVGNALFTNEESKNKWVQSQMKAFFPSENKDQEKDEVKEKRTVDLIETQIDALKKKQKELSTTREEYEGYTKKIVALEKELQAITGKTTKKKDQKTFKQELDEKKKAYELYWKWVNFAGKEAADVQFEKLLSQGSTYQQYIKNEISKLESNTVRSDLESTLLVELKSQLAEISDIDPFKTFKASVEQTKAGFSELADYIAYLKSEMDKLSDDPTSPDGEKKAYLQEELNDANRDLVQKQAQALAEMLKASADFEQQRLDLHKKYLKYYKELEKLRGQISEDEFNRRLKKLKANLDAELKQVDNEALQKLLDTQTSRSFQSQIENVFASRKKALNEEIKLLKQEVEELKKVEGSEAYILDKLNQIAGKEAELSAKRLENLNDVLSVAKQIVDEFGTQLGLNEDQVGVISEGINAMEGIQKIASGDVIQGAFQVGASLFKMLKQESIDYTESLKKHIDMLIQSAGVAERALSLSGRSSYNDLSLSLMKSKLKDISELASDVNESLEGVYYGRRGSGSSARNYGGESLREQQITLKELDEIIESLNRRLMSTSISPDQRKEIENILNSYIEIKEQLNSVYEDLTGSTVSSISDSIAQGFAEGMNSAEIFAENFEGLMQDAVLRSLQINTLQQPLNEWYEEFEKAAAPDRNGVGLTDTEISQLQGHYKIILSNAEAQWEILKDTAGLSFNNMGGSDDVNSMTGAIKGVTEQTASLLAGQINAIRMNQQRSVEVMDKSLMHLATIAQNTSYNRFLERLVSIDNKLSGLKNSDNELRANGL